MAPDVSIWDQDHVNEEHLHAFRQALEADEEAQASEAPNSPTVSNRPAYHHERTHKISAVSDFAPINTRVKRKKRRGESRGKQGVFYHILRWPLLAMIFSVIFAEFQFYVFIRQCVNAFEWLVGRGRKGTLRAKLRSAQTYEEWKDAAKTLDEYLGFNEWKKEPEDPFYDFGLVKKVLRSLRNLQDADDAHGLLGVLEVCIRNNFAGIESPRLYSETYYKTKDLIEAYTTEVEKALKYIRETPKLSTEEKRKFFRGANTNLGASALCLSGGASFGYYHFGVIRAFLDAKMLPRVIAGTSAGGLIAAMVCTHTDDELRELLVPRLADHITACEESIRVWMLRFWRTGARFDTVEWAKKSSFFTRGSLTFKEAYELTGRVLNVSVIPFSRYSPTKLLNHLTSPDCVIWSAIIASAAVPGILNPVVLMQKTKTGTIVPWNWGSRFKDGSLRVDIPLQSLNLLFNVNYPIVSQVNPHVHLFNFSARGSAGKPVAHRKGKGWRGGFILSAAEQFLKLELTKNFKVIRDLELLPQLLGQDWSSVFLQRFDGAVTIWPRSRIKDWFRLLTDPDPTELERMMHVGQHVTWPKLHMIENRYRIEKEIYRGRMAVRQALQARERERASAHPETDAAAAGADVSEDHNHLTVHTGQTPGAGPSNGRIDRSLSPNGRILWPSGSRQLPIESETEAGAEARRSWRRGRHGRPPETAGEVDTPDTSLTPNLDSNGDPSGGGRMTQGTLRRRWASVYVEEQEDEDEDDASPARHDAHAEDHRSRPLPTGSPSFMARFRTSSFPVLTSIAHTFGRSSKRQGSGESQQPAVSSQETPALTVERWSSESEDDDDEIPWQGAMITPRIASKTSLGLSPTGQDANGGGRGYFDVDEPIAEDEEGAEEERRGAAQVFTPPSQDRDV